MGSALFVELVIEGVPVCALVDMGTQSTIISRPVLHSIGRCREQKGYPLPLLRRPTVQLHGKDGARGGHELDTTANLDVALTLNGKCVHRTVFVQPNSLQPCLLGMNAITYLVIQVVCTNGDVLLPDHTLQPEVASVSVVRAMTIPGAEF